MIAGLYGMVEPSLGDPERQARTLADEGVEVIQLRCKGWPREAVRALAERCRNLAARLVINDDAALAHELGLTAHLGHGDGPALGPHGRSTHTLAHVVAEGQALYIGFGPVYATASKRSEWPPRGPALLAEAARHSRLPVVAIGGIDDSNIDEVRSSGAAGWAVIGAIWRSPRPHEVIRRLR